jgi:hypothetical protein
LTGKLFPGKQAGLKRRQADTGAVTRIMRSLTKQRFSNPAKRKTVDDK